MELYINNPLYLILIPVAIAYVVYFAVKSIRLTPFRKGVIIGIRVLILVLVILSLSGLGIKKTSETSTTIFVSDNSDSALRNKGVIEDFINESIKKKKNVDKAGVINFGADSVIEKIPTKDFGNISIRSEVNPNFTNIEKALKLASSLLPSEDKKRVVLITDGYENTGDAIKQVKILKQQGITVDVFKTLTDIGQEVLAKKIIIPQTARLDEKIEVVVEVESTVKTEGVLTLYSKNEVVAEGDVEIQTGINRYAFTVTAEKGGFSGYTAVIRPQVDKVIKNNTVSAFTYVESKGKVLVLQDENKAAQELIRIYKDNVNIDLITPENTPRTKEEMLEYDAFVLSNLSIENVDNYFFEMLESCVKDNGKGLFVTGGDESFALGGYWGTTLEKTLPVNMDLKQKKEFPSLGLILVIDKSGSMSGGTPGEEKIELAKEAAIRSTQILTENDVIGVIAFDNAVKWVVKPKKLENIMEIQGAIGTIRSGGGTQILPPLEEAYEKLKNADTKLKHIILLTDGQAEKSGYNRIIEGMNKEGITLSTVAIGDESDKRLLELIANAGNGRFYSTDKQSNIPKIFAKETVLAGKRFLNERTFTPETGSFSEILNSITHVPSLNGYVTTTAKSRAKVVLKSDTGDPILAQWQYGLGRSVAWTSDAKGVWTSDWLAWDKSEVFWRNIMSWIIQKRIGKGYSIDGSIDTGTGKLEFIIDNEDETTIYKEIKGTILSPSGVLEEIKLKPEVPGVYTGSFNEKETGVYTVNVTATENNGKQKNYSSGMVIQYSPEYYIPENSADQFLEKLVYESGGKVINNPDEVFISELIPVESIIDITYYLLLFAIILFMLDIILRRFGGLLPKIERTAVDTIKASKTVVKKAGNFKINKRSGKKYVNKKKSFSKDKSDKKDSNEVAENKSKTGEDDKKSNLDILLEKKKDRKG